MKEIRLWKNKNELSDIYTQVDDDIYEVLKNKKLYTKFNHGRYAVTVNSIWGYGLHRFIYKYDNIDIDNKIIDHIDRCPTNNIRKNLRIATTFENVWNSKCKKTNRIGYKDVREKILKSGKKAYEVRIGKAYNFKSIIAAIMCCNLMRKKYYGEFAYIESLNNFTDEELYNATIEVMNKLKKCKKFNKK